MAPCRKEGQTSAPISLSSGRHTHPACDSIRPDSPSWVNRHYKGALCVYSLIFRKKDACHSMGPIHSLGCYSCSKPTPQSSRPSSPTLLVSSLLHMSISFRLFCRVSNSTLAYTKICFVFHVNSLVQSPLRLSTG